MTSILVVDDQELIRAGLAALLRATPGFDPVLEAADGETALATTAREKPEVVLMDIGMPGMGGIVAAERILALDLDPLPRVIVLTVFDRDEYVYAALRAGCAGYLLKDTPADRLVHTISVIAGGEMLFAPSVTRRLIEAYAPQRTMPAEEHTALEQLTSREREVLLLVARGLCNEEIAAHLFVSEATVKSHLHRVMTKLDLRSRAQAVVVAYESGLALPQSGKSGKSGKLDGGQPEGGCARCGTR
ncbi:response regulator transcription factor [Streptomyces sp. NA04227]|uniref:response regulator n=1 Tax=Streptomyces sp. NA04227 TaxID=2742136 RepID=UPI00159196C5|nr:response regulator transcription factor [Streptomyces sp. NA04227]QKW07939.1 response regulator transcription factor [Streptomyces sp. NA04227]